MSIYPLSSVRVGEVLVFVLVVISVEIDGVDITNSRAIMLYLSSESNNCWLLAVRGLSGGKLTAHSSLLKEVRLLLSCLLQRE